MLINYSKKILTLFCSFCLIAFINCTQCFSQDMQILKTFPLDSMSGIITKDNVQIDKTQSTDKRGSIKITAETPKTIKLYEVKGLNIDNAKLIYLAKVKTQDVKGKAYLEMWCHFPDKGDYFSRGLDNISEGTSGWSAKETTFFLQQGQKPDLVKLNLVIEGTGTVWIDDIQLMKAPLN